jgi:hypothetical protein
MRKVTTMNRQLQIAALGAAALVLGGGGFVAGMTVGPALGGTGTTPPAASAPDAAGAQARRAAIAGQIAGGAGGQVSGRVISVADGSITVEMRQPGGEPTRSVIALVGTSTRIVKTVETEIKLADIKVGDQVLVVGQADQGTGTVSANAIVVGVNALQQLLGGQGGPGASPGVRRIAPGASPSPRP